AGNIVDRMGASIPEGKVSAPNKAGIGDLAREGGREAVVRSLGHVFESWQTGEGTLAGVGGTAAVSRQQIEHAVRSAQNKWIAIHQGRKTVRTAAEITDLERSVSRDFTLNGEIVLIGVRGAEIRVVQKDG